jgi:hypothetical protein
MPLSIQDELNTCDLLCNAQNRAYALQAQAESTGDDVTAKKFGVDAGQLDVQIELLQDKITVEWVAEAGSATATLAAGQKAISANIAAIDKIIASGKTITTALGIMDQIIQLATKIIPV